VGKMTTKTLMVEKQLRNNRKALDDVTEEMIKYTESLGIDTVFSRQAKYDESFIGIEKSRCYFGSTGICCRQCAMGPCRIWDEELPMTYRVTTPQLSKGTCGASVDTIVARNLLMMVARGTAAHASHALHIASTLKKAAQNKAPYRIKEPEKIRAIAAKLQLSAQDLENTAIQAATLAMSDIIGDENTMRFAAAYCPSRVATNLSGLGVIPG